MSDTESLSAPVFDENGRLVCVGKDLRHVAFIMDGNGRWAKKLGKPREFGHIEGAKVFEKIVEYCGKIGVEAVTVYAFSTENWKRPPEEVAKIMSLLEKYLDRVVSHFSEYDISLRFIGERHQLSDKLRRKIENAERLTEGKTKILNIAFCYGARAEITHAVNGLLELGIKNVTEEQISEMLYTSHCPDPDLVIRTAGEQRLSNFLLWQTAYAELYFTDTLWPDFGPEGVEEAITAYYRRTRRFGAVK